MERIRAKSIRQTSRLVGLAQAEGWDFYQLAEALLELDEQLTLWRLHRVNVVERQVGMKQGTGRSEGVGYLRRTLDVRGFPELWELRSRLEIPH